MITRDQALDLISKHVTNKNIVKHMLALSVVMESLAKYFKEKESASIESFIEAEWSMAGLLHDGDYIPEVLPEKQGIQITEWARESGFEIPDSVAYAMAAHNWSNTGIEPKNKMDWSIFCADSLTGLIVACALVLPSKKLSDVTPEMIIKKFGQKSFAGGTRREDIKMCEEKLGIPLPDFIKIALVAMQNIHEELGL